MPRPSNKLSAFTLVEVLVTIAILAAVSTALSSMIMYFYKSNSFLLEETSAVDSAHRGIEFAASDMREASYGDDGSYPIASAATSSVTYYADTDGNGAVEKVRLYLSGGTFYRGVTASAGSPPSYAAQPEKTYTIATSVVNASSTPIFTYYDDAGGALSSPVSASDVRTIRIQLQVDLNPKRAPEIFTLSQTATLRNLR